MLMVSKQRNTYTDWSTEIGLIEGSTISKQALHERMRPQTERFVQNVVKELISRQVSLKPSHKLNGALSHFGNVMIDDSTTISLPDALAGKFPGNVTNGTKKAQAKIHAMYNLTENNFAFLFSGGIVQHKVRKGQQIQLRYSKSVSSFRKIKGLFYRVIKNRQPFFRIGL